ncbi:MAG: fused response regulator/thioredoxin-disulfide reductase [Acidobacteria bacterium]|nr:MAG: fused response regulator/thioredoxin-disulfide reductase [Acidobacteriota bacterium]PYY09690.1 MAG: fused response regulator/thioredoxin-disulfide reductase [Acidobacteriota bacterium]
MPKPILLSVDDDSDVLRAIERDLRSQYGAEYRIMGSDSSEQALDILKQLKVRNDSVALLLADQRMPGMDGVQFLQEAMRIYPEAKRALLTAYADTSAAISAINQASINYFFLKPWDPPAERLYPQLDDMLDDWQASHRPPFEGIRVLGTRWSPRSYELRDFLARNHVPYQWIDIELSGNDPETKRLLEALGPEATKLPVALFPDGTKLLETLPAQVAQKVGLRTRAQTSFYELAIVGGGPAGLAAAVYGASEGLHTVIVEREAPGGQAGMSSRIENYLGFPTGLSGGDLARRAVVQAKRFGVEILAPQEVTGVRTEGPYRILKLADANEISCHALMIATGVQWRRLSAPGVDRLQGAGVYYGGGATEALSCKGEIIYVVGGANSAGQAAMNFAKYADRVVILVRGNSLSGTMSKYLIDQIQQTPNVQLWRHASVAEVHGDSHLAEISILCSDTNAVERVPASAMFIFIGALPQTDWLGDTVERDERGFILTGPDLIRKGDRPKGWILDRDPFLLETNVPGVFAVGDVRHGSVKRVASGVGEGSVAVQFIHQYLSKV